MSLGARSTLRWCVLLLCASAGCKRTTEKPSTERDSGQRAAASTAASTEVPPGPLSKSRDILDGLELCDVHHHGRFLDLGTDAAQKARSFYYGALDGRRVSRRGGASFLKVQRRTVAYEFRTTEALEDFQVVLRGRGTGLRWATAYMDERRISSLRLPVGKTEVLHFMPLKRELAPGRHVLKLRFWGGKKAPEAAAAELDWLRLGPAYDSKRKFFPPTQESIVQDVLMGSTPRRALALRSPTRVSCPLLIPHHGRLDLDLGFWGKGEGMARVNLLLPQQPPKRLVEQTVRGDTKASWMPVSLDLKEYAGQLAHLQFESASATLGGRVAFAEPKLRESHPERARTGRSPLVLVVLESTVERQRVPPWGRAQHLVHRAAVARDSAVFNGYRLPATLPNAVLASLLSGLPPRVHQVDESVARFPSTLTSLQRLARDATINSAFFTSVPTSFRPYGFAEGFGHYESFSPVKDLPVEHPFQRALEWLKSDIEKYPERARFLLIHARGGHPPWDLSAELVAKLPPEHYKGFLEARRGGMKLAKLRARKRRNVRLAAVDWVRLRALHDSVMTKQDRAFGRLVAFLKEKELYRDALIVHTSDSVIGREPWAPFVAGGPLAERALSAPLVVKFPQHRLAGTESNAPVTTVDLSVSIARALGLPASKEMAGLDLSVVASGGESAGHRPLMAVRGERFATRVGNFILRGAWDNVPTLCQYDVDPTCADNVFEEQHQAASASWAFTQAIERAARKSRSKTQRELAEVDDSTFKALQVWGDL